GERVRFVGDPVAVVVATSRDAAKDAAELVMVDYDELPSVVDVRHAKDADAPLIHDIAPENLALDWEIGDKASTDAAFEKAAHVARLELRNNRLIPNAMEPRAVNGHYDPGTEEFTLYLTSQNPHGIRSLLSAVVQIAPEHKLRLISRDVGGGFGSKAFCYAEEVVCLWAAKQFRKPVKWTAERSESFMSDAHGRDHFSIVELALDADHKFLGLRVDTLANLGGYMSTFGTLVPTTMYATLLSGQYDIPAIYTHVDAVYTNTAPLDAYRGAGRPEACYAIERIVEHAARQLNVDPAELRRKNFIRQFPYKTAVELEYDIGDYEASLDEALRVADYAGFSARKAESEARGMKRGIGLSTYVEACGFGPSRLLGKMGAGGGAWESAEIRVNPTGTVEVITGCHSHGQGHETTYAQVVADRFGIPVESIEILHGDTDNGQYGLGTYGSRSSVGMSAIAGACDKVVTKAKLIASHLFETDLADVDFADGVFTARATNKSLTFPELAGAAYAGHNFPTNEIEPGLHESYFFDPENFTYPAGSYVCEVEIDPATGTTKIESFVAVDDFGVVVNPMIVEGQIHGGLTQGIGQAMLENGVYDADSGQLVTGSYMDYCMPRADDLPSFKVGLTVTPTPTNPLGIKGCGEAGAIGSPPAVINAITDALKIDDIEMPATPARVWRAANAG
ncbi:MAG: xanthine dehydrogenase family protein molybdopterin-binding subunit, partial [Pseudomonadota bacterium]